MYMSEKKEFWILIPQHVSDVFFVKPAHARKTGLEKNGGSSGDKIEGWPRETVYIQTVARMSCRTDYQIFNRPAIKLWSHYNGAATRLQDIIDLSCHNTTKYLFIYARR